MIVLYGLLSLLHVAFAVPMPEGSQPYEEYRAMSCKAEVDGQPSVYARSLLSCSRLCTDNSSCYSAHYHHDNKLCVVDTTPADTIVEDVTPLDNLWDSYLRHKYMCDGNWTQLNKSCYHVSPNGSNTWTFCEQYCINLSSHLATITNEKEMDFASILIQILPEDDKFLHLGGKENPDETWRWITGEPWSYTKWSPNEPSYHSNEVCLSIFHRMALPWWGLFDWNNSDCGDLGYCFCEKSALVNFVPPSTNCEPSI
ncbi:C-type lectin domain 2 member [Mactra antiquata]